ncbi:tyrosine-protein kinase transmembrane receptor ror2-like protein [Dermatophagoides farinae]|uniref:receptor protein-tyrosine kinase n=1 Tax=Dermatophagoides farinae TaxID=6954 RepID=A0A9D4SE51_DERFA|nr:tyrosine-protein kinase transmembrane receptor Ror2-like isoform X2 [Dermatophagoides farinae]KAH7638363.1 tyrosine-protein kinase transmembrane receptor ror2-like protein [Dermatophagoides farinae]
MFAYPVPSIEFGPKSLTVVAGDNVTLSCGTLPNNDSQLTINWQRNGQSIPLSRHRQTLLHIPDNGSISSLHLDHVSELDEGVYQCTARNELGLDVSRPARLSVQFGAKITGGQRFVYNVTKGTNVPIECNARGQPAPKIELFNGDDFQPLIDGDKEHYSNVFIQFNATNTTNITCRASNFLTPLNKTVQDVRIYEIYVQEIKEPTEQLESIIELEEEEEEKKRANAVPSGYCAPYIGQICRGHVAKNSLVFYNVSDAEDFTNNNNMNEEIVKNLWKELITSLQEPCKSAAEKLLCHYAFPQCSWTKQFPMAKPLCQEDCIAIRESFCNREWALLEDNRQRGVYFKSRGHFRLPVCEWLPSHENHTNPEQCTHAELTTFRKEKATIDCIEGRGRFYQGTVNVTKHGIPCQRWDSQLPHAHNRPPFVFQEIWHSENYCRNAGGEEPLPWCYTNDPYVRWQHCDIAPCEPKNDHDNNYESSIRILHGNNNRTIIMSFRSYSYVMMNLIRKPLSSVLHAQHPLLLPLSIGLVIMFIAIVTSIITMMVRRIRYQMNLYASTMTTTAMQVNGGGGLPTDLDLSKLPSNNTYHCTSAILNPKLEPLEYPRNKIIYVRDIGCGAFGRVFLAKAPGLLKHDDDDDNDNNDDNDEQPKQESTTLVAVKVLRQEASIDMQSDFEREAILMSEFDHPNVVRLLGVCALGKPMCLLVEYMAYGDLASFLRSLGPANYVIRHPNQEAFVDFPKKMTTEELVKVARQIAAGMVYLSSKHFVHRDLATRNCLVDDKLVVKISDFGLSQRMIKSANYYRADIANDALPIRWMPLEAILYGRFTTTSDVWSFGVLLWEIFSYALQPYYGLTHEQVICYLNEGNSLTQPECCPDEIYGLMKTCWQREPSARPSFEALERSLKDFCQSFAETC